jgi:hypothetical protein
VLLSISATVQTASPLPPRSSLLAHRWLSSYAPKTNIHFLSRIIRIDLRPAAAPGYSEFILVVPASVPYLFLSWCFYDNISPKGGTMKTIFMLLMFILFISINARAGEWILWQNQTISVGTTEQPIPLTEHKTLTACKDASKKVADSTRSSAKSDETVDSESVMRSVDPDGVGYNSKNGQYFIHIQYRCYPYGVVPMKEHFTPSE